MVAFYVPGMTNSLYSGIAPRAYAETPTPLAAATNVPAATAAPVAATPVAAPTATPTALSAAALPATPAAPAGMSQEMWQTVLKNAGPQAVAQLAAAEQGQRQAEAAYTAAQQASAQYEAATKNPWDGTYSRPTAGLDPLAVDLLQRYGTQGLQFVTNKGNPASIKESELGKKGATATSTGFVPLDPNAQYRLINEKGKDRVLYTGTGEEGLKNVYAMAQDLSATKGKKANWGVEMLDPATGQWSRVADDDPAKKWTSVVGDVLGTALPIATALIPGMQFLGPIATTALAGGAGAALAGRDPLKGAVMGGLSAAGGQLLGPVIQSAGGVATNLGTAIGTGLGTTAGGLATGQNLQNALLGGVAAGGLSYLGGEVFGPKGGAQSGTDVGQTAADAVGQTVGQQAGEQLSGGLGDIVVQAASRGIAPNLGAITSAIGGSAGNLLMNQIPGSTGSQPVQEAPSLGDLNQIVVTAQPQTPPINLGTVNVPSLLPSQPPSALEQVQQQLEQQQQQQAADENQITVTAADGTPINLGTVNVPIGGGGGLNQTSPTLEDPNLTVTAKEETPINLGTTVLPIGGSLVPTGPVNQTVTPSEQPPTLDENSTLDDIIKYLRLGGLGLGLIGDLVGGGSSGGKQGTIPGGLFGGSRSPVFGSTLPAPSMPGLAAGAGPRTAADLAGQGLGSNIDYYRYGYGPEQSFRSNIPAAPRNTSTAYTGYEVPFKGLEKMARGGFAVGGPGDGRDDKIPAMLSDGEYVIDAETVAMLGNGSTKAGADALDNFRVNIRKHKGRALSKGEFSDNAKKPEQYLKKGRR